MRGKGKNGIYKILIGLLLVGMIVAIGQFVTMKYFQTSTGIEENQVEKIDKGTLSELIYDASTEIYKGPGEQGEKIAYITIDDGPSKYTNQILDILAENDVKATFFMIEGNMRKHKDAVQRMVNENHGFGFHSVSHEVKKLYKSPEVTVGEFDACNETLNNISGKSSKLIRLPYGSKPYMPKDSYEKLVENDYLIWDWNLDTQDWKSTTDQIISNVLYYGRDRKEVVVLMHEKEQSVEALDSVIKILKQRGYEILPISDYKTPKNFWQGNLK